jgi:hypothetical protein
MLAYKGEERKESHMNIGQSQSTLQAYGNTFSQTSPTAQTKVPTNVQTAAVPHANSTQRADAVQRPEAPARSASSASPEVREETRPSSSGPEVRRGAKLDILA